MCVHKARALAAGLTKHFVSMGHYENLKPGDKLILNTCNHNDD